MHDFPQLTLADVHAALAYYFDHREEIQRDMADADELVNRLKAQQEPGILERHRMSSPVTSSIFDEVAALAVRNHR